MRFARTDDHGVLPRILAAADGHTGGTRQVVRDG